MSGDRTAATAWRRRAASADGATAIEYAIMVTLIATVIMFAVFLVGQQLQSDYDCAEKHVTNTPNDPSAVTCR